MQKHPRFALALAASLLVWGGRAAAQEAISAPPGVTTRAVEAEWLYSRDGGKTFTKKPPAGAPPSMKTGIVPLAFRGAFRIDDPAQTAGLWVRIAEPGETPRAAICDGDLTAAAGGYWKDLGFCPTLLNARLTLNGQHVTLAHGPMLYFWLPVEGELRKGRNTIELAGDCYTYWELRRRHGDHGPAARCSPAARCHLQRALAGRFWRWLLHARLPNALAR